MPVDRKYQYDWDYYLFYYEYAIKNAESISTQLLSKADQNCLLVITSSSRITAGKEKWKMTLPENAATTIEDHTSKYLMRSKDVVLVYTQYLSNVCPFVNSVH